jgi:hypothetical protein
MFGREQKANDPVGAGKLYFVPGFSAQEAIVAAGPGRFAKAVQHGHGFRAESRRALITALKNIAAFQAQAAGILLNDGDGEFPILNNRAFHWSYRFSQSWFISQLFYV